ncbi:MAG: glutathione S-transferase family protein [Geminicoccaceae bacterium]
MHHLYATYGSGNCYKAHLVMSQLGIAYETTWVDVVAGENREDWFTTLNPNGTVPFLRLAGGGGIAESNAMLWYLAKGTDLSPRTGFEEATTVQWMIFEQTKLEPNISPARFFTTIVPARRAEMADQIEAWQGKGAAGLAMLDQHLDSHNFVVGDRYTIADIAIYGYVHVADQGGFDLTAFPAVERWLSRVQQSSGYVDMPTFRAEAA